MESEITKLNDLLLDQDLYKREPVKFQKASDMLTERQEALAAAEEEWLDLSDRT
jgi:ATP-binding cassette subfamily F protein uup